MAEYIDIWTDRIENICITVGEEKANYFAEVYRIMITLYNKK